MIQCSLQQCCSSTFMWVWYFIPTLKTLTYIVYVYFRTHLRLNWIPWTKVTYQPRQI
jgi:hypothetical protein